MWTLNVNGEYSRNILVIKDLYYIKSCTYFEECNTCSFLCRYFLASFYTKYDTAHFVINTASLLSVLIPKLPQLHGVRIFGINKY